MSQENKSFEPRPVHEIEDPQEESLPPGLSGSPLRWRTKESYDAEDEDLLLRCIPKDEERHSIEQKHCPTGSQYNSCQSNDEETSLLDFPMFVNQDYGPRIQQSQPAIQTATSNDYWINLLDQVSLKVTLKEEDVIRTEKDSTLTISSPKGEIHSLGVHSKEFQPDIGKEDLSEIKVHQSQYKVLNATSAEFTPGNLPVKVALKSSAASFQPSNFNPEVNLQRSLEDILTKGPQNQTRFQPESSIKRQALRSPSQSQKDSVKPVGGRQNHETKTSSARHTYTEGDEHRQVDSRVSQGWDAETCLKKPAFPKPHSEKRAIETKPQSLMDQAMAKRPLSKPPSTTPNSDNHKDRCDWSKNKNETKLTSANTVCEQEGRKSNTNSISREDVHPKEDPQDTKLFLEVKENLITCLDLEVPAPDMDFGLFMLTPQLSQYLILRAVRKPLFVKGSA